MMNRSRRYGVRTSRMTTNQRRDLRLHTPSVRDTEHSTRGPQEDCFANVQARYSNGVLVPLEPFDSEEDEVVVSSLY